MNLTNEELAALYNDYETATKLRWEDFTPIEKIYLKKLQKEIINRFLDEYLYLNEEE